MLSSTAGVLRSITVVVGVDAFAFDGHSARSSVAYPELSPESTCMVDGIDDEISTLRRAHRDKIYVEVSIRVL